MISQDCRKATRLTLAWFFTQSNPKGRHRNFSAGQILFIQGTIAKGCYVIQKGTVELRLTSPHGSCITVEMVGAGNLIGLSAAFADHKYVLTARAVSDTNAIYIPCEQVIRSLRTHPEMRMLILASLSRSLQRAISRSAAARLSPRKKNPIKQYVVK